MTYILSQVLRRQVGSSQNNQQRNLMIFELNSFAQKHVVVWKVINHYKSGQGSLDIIVVAWRAQPSCLCCLTDSITPRPSYSPLNHL